MAIQTSIITFKGKLDNVVGMKGFGHYNMRKKVDPANPRTVKQLTQRAKVAVIGTFAGKIKFLVNKTFKNSKRTSFAEFINKNFEVAIGGSYPNFEMDFSKVQVAQGPVMLPDNPSASEDSGNISVSWTDNSIVNMMECTGDDKVCVLVYNSAKEQTIPAIDVAKRSDNQTTVAVPTNWSGDNVEVWLCMHQPDNNSWGESAYLGSISL